MKTEALLREALLCSARDLADREQRDARTLALLKRWQWKRDSDLCGYCGAFRVTLESCSNTDCELAALIRELEP